MKHALTPEKGLEQKEFALIQELSRRPTHTQRSLSQSVGLSLGTINILIQRLARKGYIKVTQLDWKRTQYLLTLKGAMEKTQKAYHYTVYTIRIFRQIQDNIATLLRREYDGGRRRFFLVAQHEILDILREAVTGLAFADAEFCYCRAFEEVPTEAELVLTATLEAPPSLPGRRFVSLVDFDDIDFRIS
jgi:DNA-binding MarR family transcriptional regulator